jgi:amino acid transporter
MAAESSSTVDETTVQRLRPNSIGLPGVLFQSVTTMAPASAVSFSLGAAIPYAGASLPLVVIITFIVCILIALNISALAKYLPSAGGYFTFVSHGLGNRVGWIAGWLFNLAYLLIVPFQLLVLGPVMDSFMQSTFHVSLGSSGWAIWAAVFAVVIFVLTYLGIKVSADLGVVLGAIEIVVFVALSAFLIISAGSQNTVAVFTPTFSRQPGLGGWQGVLFGMIFTVLAFAGFESAAPLAEESRNPRKTVSRAIILAVICIGAFYILCSYAGVVAWGTAKIGTYSQDPNPWGTMAARVWGPWQILVILAILNSALANSNAGVNAATRVLYAMGRTRTLPPVLARVNRFGAPSVATILTMVVAIVVALASGFAFTPGSGFAFLGTVLSLPIIIVYMLTCLSVPFYYWRERKSEWSIWRHIVVPVVPLLVLAVVLVFQFVPLPAAPLVYAGPIAAAWLVIGIVVVFVLSPIRLSEGQKIYTGEAEEK